MKLPGLSRAIWGSVLVCGISLVCARLAFAQGGSWETKWDPGIRDKWFKDDKTDPKKPTHRLAPVCPDCQGDADKLQAALDDWYLLQFVDGEQIRKDGLGKQDGDQQAAGNACKANALAGLGLSEKEVKEKLKPPKKGEPPKPPLPDRKAAKAKIDQLAEALQKCLDDKCPPPGAVKPVAPEKPKEQPKKEEGSQPNDGGQPGGGEKPKGGVKPLPTLPTLPECWKAGMKEKFESDLKEAEEDLLKQRGYYGTHGGFNGNQEDREAAARKVNEALKKINDLRQEAEKIKPCPNAMAPKPPGETFAVCISSGNIAVATFGTGETIGHVADLRIDNRTDHTVICFVPPLILESGSGKNQNYACPEGQQVALQPHESKTVSLNGVCLNRNRPPVGKGIGGDLVMNDPTSEIPQDRHPHIKPRDADKLLRICSAKYDAVEKLQKDGALKDLPYRDRQKQKDICLQWSVWSDPRVCEITGAPPATRDDLKKVVYKQVDEQGSVTPEKKKKIDQGIDNIFEKIELTNEKAKDLEKPEGENVPEDGSTIEETPPGGQPEYIGQTQAKKPTPTATPKKKSGGGTTSKPTPTPTPKEEPKGGASGESAAEPEEQADEVLPVPSYPFKKAIDCGTIEIAVGTKGDLIFDFLPNGKCPCKEFGWVQHISPEGVNNWHYDNGAMGAGIGAKKVGAKSDPSSAKQPTQPPKGTKLQDWNKNPWYGGTTDPKKPADFDEHPTPQTHISDAPDVPNSKFRTQLVCVATGEVYFTWAWGPTGKGNIPVDKMGGASVPPPK